MATDGSRAAARAAAPDRGVDGYAENDREAQAQYAAFYNEFQKLGWTEGSNVRIDIRWAPPADADLMQRLAKELVALQPDLLLSSTTPTTTALLRQTHVIPIVFATVSDPIDSGFVASFSRPGGNATGFSVTEPTQAGKWVELLKAIAPHVARVTMLFNPASATHAEYWLPPFNAAAASFGMEANSAPVHDGSELDSVFAAQAKRTSPTWSLMTPSGLTAHLDLRLKLHTFR